MAFINGQASAGELGVCFVAVAIAAVVVVVGLTLIFVWRQPQEMPWSHKYAHKTAGELGVEEEEEEKMMLHVGGNSLLICDTLSMKLAWCRLRLSTFHELWHKFKCCPPANDALN